MASIFNKISLTKSSKSVVDYESYRYYIDNAKVRDKKAIYDVRHYSKIIGEIYKKIGRGAIEYEGGFIDPSFFALLSIKNPVKTGAIFLNKNTNKIQKTFAKHSDGFMYRMTFIPLMRGTLHRSYDTTRTLSSKLIKAFEKFKKEKNFKYSFPVWDLINKK